MDSSSRSQVDNTRPFRSVREAVAVFGERILAVDAHSQRSSMNPRYEKTAPKPIDPLPIPKPIYSATSSPPSYSSSSSHFNEDGEDQLMILASLKKLEAELEETKRELTVLKKKESETEIVVASLNAELHKGMSRLSELEAVGMAKASTKSSPEIEEDLDNVGSNRWGEESHGDSASTGLKYLPSLAKVLSLGEMEGSFGGRKKTKVVKKKPIIPLIGDLLSKKKKKKGSNDLHDSLYTPSFYSVIS